MIRRLEEKKLESLKIQFPVSISSFQSLSSNFLTLSLAQHIEQRVAVFVDVSNMYYSAKNLYKSKVDFKKLLANSVENRKLIRAFAYVIKADIEAERGFFGALSKQGYEVRSKDLQIFFGGAKKGDWDVGMAIDAVILSEKIDVVIIVSGDGDFAPLVDYLKNAKGCRVEIVAFGRTASNQLVEKADAFLDIDKTPRSFLIRETRPNRSK